MRKILVAGNGIAAASALRVLFTAPKLQISVVSPEFYPACYKPFFPLVSSGKLESYEAFLLEHEDYSRENITFIPGVKIQKLSTGKRSAQLSNGEEIEFDSALIATGSSTYIPARLEKEVRECRNIFTQDTIQEALDIKALIEEGARNSVVIGAGRTGVSLANALATRGMRVFLIEKEKKILPSVLDEDLATTIEEILERKGTTIITDARIQKISASDRFVESIYLQDGTKIPCQLAIIATGRIPNTEFLEGNFALAPGLITNQNLETQESGIFAAGDVVQFIDFNSKRKFQKLAFNAWREGEIAARNILGENVICPPSFSGKFVEIDDTFAGHFGERDGTDYLDLSANGNNVRFTVEGFKITGIQFVGQIEKVIELASEGLNRLKGKKVPDEIKTQISREFPIFKWNQKLFNF